MSEHDEPAVGDIPPAALAPWAVVRVARDGTIAGWNPAAERLFGLPTARAVGRHHLELADATSRALVRDAGAGEGVGNAGVDEDGPGAGRGVHSAGRERTKLSQLLFKLLSDTKLHQVGRGPRGLDRLAVGAGHRDLAEAGLHRLAVTDAYLLHAAAHAAAHGRLRRAQVRVGERGAARGEEAGQAGEEDRGAREGACADRHGDVLRQVVVRSWIGHRRPGTGRGEVKPARADPWAARPGAARPR